MQANYRVIDLSRPIHTKMPTFPLVAKTFLGIYQGHHETLRPGNVSSQSNILMMCDHAGTHIDSPLHFNPEGTSIDKLPLENMVGAAAVVDFSAKAAGESVTPAELEAALKKIGVEPKDLKFILIRTGADALYGREEYWGRYLEIRADTVEWMLDRGILIFGVDASTVDHAKDRATHMLMRKRPCYHIENLTNLDQLPADRTFTFICNPLLMLHSSAAPFRALALVTA
jgi:kynurenine formamidase